MSQADELLNGLTDEEASTYLARGDNEPHIVINADRTITVPAELKRIAVQFDHNVETVTFDAPRKWDNHDFVEGGFSVWINYLRADGHPGAYLVTDLVEDPDDENLMHFTWTISEEVTAVKGNLAILVCVKKTDAEGKSITHWNSELNKELYVSEGMEYVYSENEYTNDVVQALLTRMDELELIGLSTHIDISKIDNGNRVTITTTDGVRTFDVIDGVDFIPSVSDDGILSWTNDRGYENPKSVNLTGPRGEIGSIYSKVELVDDSAEVDVLRKYRIRSDVTSPSLDNSGIEHSSNYGNYVTDGRYIYCFAPALSGSGDSNYLSIFDTETRTFKETTIGFGYSDSATIIIDNDIYVFGGRSKSSESNKIYVSSLTGYDDVISRSFFVALDATFDNTLYGAYPYYDDGKVYLIGGDYGTGANTTIKVFDMLTKTITEVKQGTTGGISPMTGIIDTTKYSIVKVDDKLYYFSSEDGSGIYNLKTGNLIKYMGSMPVTKGGAAAIGSKIYMFGRSTREVGGAIHEYDCDSDTMTKLDITLPLSTDNVGVGVTVFKAITVKNNIYLFSSNNDVVYIFNGRSLTCKVEIKHSDDSHEIDLTKHYTETGYIDFEVLDLKYNSTAGTYSAIYEVDGERYVDTFEASSEEECKLVISSASSILAYNMTNDDIEDKLLTELVRLI